MDEEQRKLLESLSKLAGASDELSDRLQSQVDNYNVLLVAGTKEQAAMAKHEVIVTKTNQAYDQQMKALGLTKNALGEYERITVKLTAEQKKRLAEEQAISEKQQARDKASAAYHAMMADKTGTLLKGLKAFGEGLNKTIFDSTKGQSKYGEILDGAGDKVMALGLLFGPFGKAVTFATGGLMKLAGAALKQQEELNKAYETLSEFGAVDATGIAGMFQNLQNAGFVMKEMDKFSGIIKAAGPNLATLGTTAAEGAKKFADTLAAVKNTGVEKELRMLGFTTESMAKTFADFQGLQGRLGFIQGKSSKEVADQSVRYAKTLDELSKLTGESRDEMQKRMEADANDIKFRLKLQEVSEKDRERMQKASALIADFGEDTASGFREMVANNGQVVGEASTKLMLSTGNAAKQIVEDLNAGKISHVEAARLIAEAKAKQVERFRSVGKLDADIMKELGITVKDMDAINKYRGKTAEEMERMEADRKKQMQAENDRQRAAEVQRQITERNMEQAKDRLINALGKTLVPALEFMHKVVMAVGKGLAEFTKFITFGKVDFTDLFKSTDDITKDLNTTKTELDKTNKQIADITNARERYLQKEQEYLKKNEEINELEIKISQESNAEKRKELEATLAQARKERATLKAEADQARTDAKRGGSQLQKLQQDKSRLETQQAAQQEQLTAAESKGSVMGTPSQGKISSMGSYLQKVAQIESGGDASAKAKTSSASGLFQFTEGTWKHMTKEMGKDYSLEDRFDPKKAAEVAAFFTAKQSGQLEKALGRTPSDAELYMAHFLGAGGAIKFLTAMSKSPGAPATEGADPKQIEANKSIFYEDGGKGKLRTLQDVFNLMNRKVEKAGDTIAQGKGGADIGQIPTAQSGGLMSGPDGGYPVLLHGKELVIPMPNTGDISSVLDNVTKTALGDAAGAPNTGSSAVSMDQFITLQTDLMNMIANKLDMLDSRLAKSNDIQENILTYSSA